MTGLDRKVVGLLAAGFTLLILLMLLSGQRGLNALRELGRSSTDLLAEERAGGRALSNAQELEAEFDELLYSVPGTRQPMLPSDLEARLTALEASVRRTTVDGLSSGDSSDTREWQAFEEAGLAFVKTIRSAVSPQKSRLAIDVPPS